MDYTGNRASVPGLLLLSLALLAGCNGGVASPSGWYATSSIYAYMRAAQDESGTVTTTVQLRDGATSSAGYLYLSNGDALYASLDISPRQYLTFDGNLFAHSLELAQHLKVMPARDVFFDYGVFTTIAYGKPEYYATDMPAAGSATTRAYVAFERLGSMGTASFVDLPPPFRILAPSSEASLSRATPLALAWTDTDPSSTMELDVAGSCTDNSRFNLHLTLGADTGSATLNGSDYFSPSVSPALNCRVAFILQRIRLNGVSPQFAFGSFRGVQQRTVQFISTP